MNNAQATRIDMYLNVKPILTFKGAEMILDNNHSFKEWNSFKEWKHKDDALSLLFIKNNDIWIHNIIKIPLDIGRAKNDTFFALSFSSLMLLGGILLAVLLPGIGTIIGGAFIAFFGLLGFINSVIKYKLLNEHEKDIDKLSPMNSIVKDRIIMNFDCNKFFFVFEALIPHHVSIAQITDMAKKLLDENNFNVLSSMAIMLTDKIDILDILKPFNHVNYKSFLESFENFKKKYHEEKAVLRKKFDITKESRIPKMKLVGSWNKLSESYLDNYEKGMLIDKITSNGVENVKEREVKFLRTHSYLDTFTKKNPSFKAKIDKIEEEIKMERDRWDKVSTSSVEENETFIASRRPDQLRFRHVKYLKDNVRTDEFIKKHPEFSERIKKKSEKFDDKIQKS